MSKRCPYCGAFLKGNAARCGQCGKTIGKAARKKKSALPFLLALADIGLLVWIIQSYLSS